MLWCSMLGQCLVLRELPCEGADVTNVDYEFLGQIQSLRCLLTEPSAIPLSVNVKGQKSGSCWQEERQLLAERATPLRWKCLLLLV